MHSPQLSDAIPAAVVADLVTRERVPVTLAPAP